MAQTSDQSPSDDDGFEDVNFQRLSEAEEKVAREGHHEVTVRDE